jgi:hypothetical protein
MWPATTSPPEAGGGQGDTSNGQHRGAGTTPTFASRDRQQAGPEQQPDRRSATQHPARTPAPPEEGNLHPNLLVRP